MDKKILLLNIGICLLIVVILAMIASDVIAYRLSKTFPRHQTGTTTGQTVARRDNLSNFAPILEKGLFGKPTQGTLTPIAVADASGPAATSPGDLTLLGTAVGSFRETFALIARQSTSEERVFRLGDTVFEIGPLVAVQKDFIEIDNHGARMKLHAPTDVPGAPSGSPEQQALASNQLASQVSAGNYVIDQRALSAALANIGQAMTDARLLPSMKDGVVEGFKVSEVRPSGIFAMIGLSNGDMLQKVNDIPMDSPDKAMQTLMSLQGQNRIKVDLTRDGRPLTLNYDIR
ncbi:MAG TPA: type II secretion system protein GspC [Geobacteraceae bacterium]|nr:type II secretion system protein GspC [Geobacteraceae bacterium]